MWASDTCADRHNARWQADAMINIAHPDGDYLRKEAEN